VLTAVAFRPDGRRALTVRITPVHCVAAALVGSGLLCAALAIGWLLGEWTARL